MITTKDAEGVYRVRVSPPFDAGDGQKIEELVVDFNALTGADIEDAIQDRYRRRKAVIGGTQDVILCRDLAVIAAGYDATLGEDLPARVAAELGQIAYAFFNG